MSTIRRAGRNRLARRFGVPEIPAALERLQANGPVPERIFDAGALRSRRFHLQVVHGASAGKASCRRIYA
jgi:hypothetical protein